VGVEPDAYAEVGNALRQILFTLNLPLVREQPA
jgi:hypothetical protein